jgi:pimeloyl-ACP methyl ester carboxylesterase
MAEEQITIVTPAGEIAAWTGGTGPETAVLLHGGPGMSEYLDTLVPFCAPRFRTVRYQQRSLAPTTIGGPFTVDAHVADAAAVIDDQAGGRAWVIGHSWGGHLALHMLVACPERIAGAVIVDPLGAFMDVMEEFGENLQSGLDDTTRRRLDEIEAREDAGEATAEDSLESLSVVWPNYFADPATAPPMPPLRLSSEGYAETFASLIDHAGRGTLTTGLPQVPPEIPVTFIHGAQSPMPLRTSVDTAALIPHAQVEVIEDSGHFMWLEQSQAMRAAIARLPA